jgi:hypothetical protein
MVVTLGPRRFLLIPIFLFKKLFIPCIEVAWHDSYLTYKENSLQIRV